MSVSPSISAVICEEIFDETSHPSTEEILDYAVKLGIDPLAEPQLLPLAKEGLMRALPNGWRPCYDEGSQSYYYYNPTTQQTQWEHPLDETYRQLVKEARKKSTADVDKLTNDDAEDGTYTKDLLSFEEDTAVKKPSLQDKVVANIEKHPKLILTGNGSKFLKINTKKSILRENSALTVDKDDEEDKKIVRFNLETMQRSFEDLIFSDEEQEEEKPAKIKSRFTISAVFDNYPKRTESIFEKIENADKEEENLTRNTNLKLIKPNPIDFITPKLIQKPLDVIKPINFLSDSSEDEQMDKFNAKFPKEDAILTEKLIVQDAIPEENEDKSKTDDDEQNGIKKLETFKELNETLDKHEKKSNLKYEKTNLVEKEEFDENYELLEKIKAKKQEIEGKFNFEQLEHQYEEKLESKKQEFESKLQAKTEELDQKLSDKLKELEEHFKENVQKIEQTFRQKEKEIESNFQMSLKQTEAEFVLKLEERVQEMKAEHKTVLDRIKDDHELTMNEMRREFKNEEMQLRQSHVQSLSSLRQQLSTSVAGEYEKIRCEKRLLEDKYKCLKEKYIRLKSDVEKKRIRRNTKETGSETERSSDKKGSNLDRSHIITDSSNKRFNENFKPDLDTSMSEKSSSRIQNNNNRNTEKKKKTFTRLRSNSASKAQQTTGYESEINEYEGILSGHKSSGHVQKQSTIDSDKNTLPEHVLRTQHVDVNPIFEPNRYKTEINVQKAFGLEYNAYEGILKPQKSSVDQEAVLRAQKIETNAFRKSPGIEINQQEIMFRPKTASADILRLQESIARSCSPVENLRRQLQKLEDLEDQFPAVADTYHLRYPFTDNDMTVSSSLAFFRHRIHVERDSVRRAKDTLRSQKTAFQQRQQQHRHAAERMTNAQVVQEERDLSDMEVSLHRTRSLLGEKVIRLRHLEKSLQRLSNSSPIGSVHVVKNCDDGTLSDLSSHSASSGISSSEFATAAATDNFALNQQPKEIIQSLENLNYEIKEIWDVLKQQQQQQQVQSLALPFSTLLVANQTQTPTALLDRTKNLREWLKHHNNGS